VEGQFRGDIFTAKKFAAVALPEHVKALEEIERQFASEFDYRREAGNLELVRGNLARAGATFAHFDVPRPFLPLCTKAVLVMTEIPACSKLTTALGKDLDFFAAQRGMSTAALVEEERALNAAALAAGQLRCGPSSDTMASWISQLRWRNWALGWLGYPPSHVPLNHAHLMDELLRVHGHEVLVDGAFNGDPHPGNVLVSQPNPGAPPRIALVDYGQVKVLTAAQRLQVARLMAAHARAQPQNPAHRARICQLMRSMGFSGERGDVDVGYALSQLFFDKDDLLVTGGKNTQAYIEGLQARDATKDVGQDFVLVARCSLMLRGLGHQLNQHRSAALAWQPIADKVMREMGEDPDKVLL
jgi:aarF domain-containing kinase